MVSTTGMLMNKDWKFMKSYSPYYNVHPDQPYTKALILEKTQDDMVHPSHGRKMCARLQKNGYETLYYEGKGGHVIGRAFEAALVATDFRMRLMV